MITRFGPGNPIRLRWSRADPRDGFIPAEVFGQLIGSAEAGGMRYLEIVEINTALDVNNKTAELGVELILSALGKTIL